MAPIGAVPLLLAGLSLGLLVRGDEECHQDVDCILKQMTLDEKLQFFAGDLDAIDHISGVERLGIPDINMGDGPNGVANTIPGTATSFPCNKAIGDTWDRDLTRRYSNAMAKEFKAKGKNMMLGPGTNLARIPEDGRMDEYIPGEDPVIGAELIPQFVQGTRDENVMVSIKHYAMNVQETNRNEWNANPDTNVAMEYYLRAARAGVEAGAANLMCGYNKVNGLHDCKSKGILQAAKSWGDKFWIVSDWGAIYPDAANGGAAVYLNAGVDMEMGAHDDAGCVGPDVPATKYGGAGYCNKGAYMLPGPMKAMLDAGTVTHARVDETVRRVLGALKTVGLLQNSTAQAAFPPYVYEDYHSKWFGPLAQKDVRTSHSRQVAYEVATKAMVLVQNRDSLLPLNKETHKIEMYGCGAGEVKFHAVSGSASGTAPHVPKVPCKPDFATACMYPPDGAKAVGAQVTSYNFSEGANGPRDPEAVTVVCLEAQFLNGEGTDRKNLDMKPFPYENFKKVVVWAIAPGPVILDFAPKVDALLVSSLPGEMGGSALTSILFGTASPAAHLTMSMPHTMHDTSIRIHQDSDNFDEGFEMGYRWYEAHNTRPIFSFGWGLSYAKQFQVPVALFQPPKTAAGRPSVKMHLYREVGTFVAQTDQVVQFYVQHKAPSFRSFKELAGFGKLEGLKGGGWLMAEVELDTPMVWDSQKGEKLAYDRSWVPVTEYTVFISLYGVEHAIPLFAVTIEDGKYSMSTMHDFKKYGSIKFDQDLAVHHQSLALSGTASQKPEEHQWDEIPALAAAQGEPEIIV